MDLDRRKFLKLSATVGAAGVIAPSWIHGHGQTREGVRLDRMTKHEFIALRRFVKTKQGQVAYVEHGKGKAALFLHGFPLNSFQWRDAISHAAPYRRCIAPDFMGLGYTMVTQGQSVAPSAQVEMLRALLDRLQIDRVDLVANDSGGAVAQLFMVSHPDRVRSALLTNCDVEPDSPPPALTPVIELARAGTYPDLWLAPWVEHKDLARSAKGLGGIAYTYPNRLADDTIEYYLRPLVASRKRKTLVNEYVLGLTPNPLAGIRERLAHCQAPVKIIWGTGDDIFSSESPDYLDRLFPNSKGVRRIAHAKLFFPEEFPEIIAEEAIRLWGEAGGTDTWL